MSTDERPPNEIDEKVIAALARDGVIGRGRPLLSAWQLWAAVAAGIAAAVTAWLLVQRAPLTSGEPRFVLLLYAGDASTRDAAGRRDEYASWARDVAEKGTAISAEELADDADDPDGPRGFFIITARDMEAARAIASTCPHIRYGGRIVVRRIVS